MGNTEQARPGITVSGPHEDGMYEAGVEKTALRVRADSEEAALRSLVKMLPEGEHPPPPMDA